MYTPVVMPAAKAKVLAQEFQELIHTKASLSEDRPESAWSQFGMHRYNYDSARTIPQFYMATPLAHLEESAPTESPDCLGT